MERGQCLPVGIEGSGQALAWAWKLPACFQERALATTAALPWPSPGPGCHAAVASCAMLGGALSPRWHCGLSSTGKRKANPGDGDPASQL